MIGRQEARPLPPEGFWQHLRSMTDETDWRDIVTAAAWTADELAAPSKEWRDLQAAIARAEPRFSHAEWAELGLDDRAMDFAQKLLGEAVRVGFALARPWEDWPRRALVYAGIPIEATAPPSSAPSAPAAPPAGEPSCPPLSADARDDLVEIVQGDHVDTVVYQQHQSAILALLERLPEDLRGLVDTAFSDEQADAERYGILLAYALGRTGGSIPPTDAALARARSVAGLDAMPRRDSMLSALGLWMAEHGVGGAAEDALTHLLADLPGLKTHFGPPAPP